MSDLVLSCAYDDLSGVSDTDFTVMAEFCYMDGPIRFTDKSLNGNERYLFNTWWQEIINEYGQSVDYYVNAYSLSSQDALYGEDTIAGYNDPKPIIIGVFLSNDSLLLSRFGIQSTTDFTALIHISSYYAVFGYGAEPKSDDVIRLTEYGNDRPGGRTGAMYQITSRDDEDLSQINQLAGHYMWLVRGKRYDYTSEPNIPKETVMDQVYDNFFAGALSGSALSSVSAGGPKVYNYDVDTAALSTFNYAANNVDTSVYGKY
jgi:hypothetical protein